MVIGNILQRFGYTLDQVLLLDRRHGRWSTQTAEETPGKAGRSGHAILPSRNP
jgi:hypothetical protein